MDENEPRDDFAGNPWHPFLRVLRRRAANLPPERRCLPIPTEGANPPPTWDDLFRLDPEVGRLVPARDLAEAEVRALADWLGLADEEHAAFLELGAAFLAQRDVLRQLRDDPTLAEEEEAALGEADPRPARPRPPQVVPPEEPVAGGSGARPGEPPEDAVPGWEAASTASDCLRLLCRFRLTDMESLARAVARRVSDLDERAILLQLRGTLPVVADRVLEAALAILNAPAEVAARARAVNGR
jgi:hypothetical protein